MPGNIFFTISLLFGLTVLISGIVRSLRQPLIIAYIVTGILSGPLFFNLLPQGEIFIHSFAEFGIVLLLFIVGLSLNITHLKKIGRVAVTAGVLQLLATGTCGFLVLHAAGLPLSSAGALSIASVFSSTVIIVKLLSDKRALESVYGRYTVGLLLVQDLMAILLMIFLTTKTGGSFAENTGLLILKGTALAIGMYAASRFFLSPMLRRIAESPEFLFLFTIAWCFGISSLLEWMGFSLEIGAVLAGFSLGTTPYQLEIMSRVKPLRDFFIILFFIILGSELEVHSLLSSLGPSLSLSSFILIGNPIILYSIYRSHKFTRRNSFLGGTTAAQVSEFGFILLFTARELGYVGSAELTLFTFTALTTIFISSYLITYNEQLYRFFLPFFQLFGKDRYVQPEETTAQYDVLVIGYHRIGWKICEALKQKKLSFAIIDHNPETIAHLRRHNTASYFGDISDIEFLEALPFEKAKMVLITVPDPEPQLTLIRYLKKTHPSTLIIGNLHHAQFVPDLYKAGATFVMMPHLLGGNWIADVLREKPWTRRTFSQLKQQQTADLKQRYSVGMQ